jgi:hypothetical protein
MQITEINPYLEKGWFVLPLKEKSKIPSFKVKHGFKGSSNDPFVIADWFKKPNNSNLGIACEMSGLIVIDFDFRNMTEEANEFYGKFDLNYYEETMAVSTGDGVHYYFKTERFQTFPGKIMDGIDIKYNGYVVASPSIHPNGKEYVWNKREPIVLPKGIIQGRGI